ncbi:MAG: aminotransferase class IV [Saprospiraceae bacterium]|nr:aminotransferase class IV [Saprospiraceae bacterium]MBP8096125.1 aminotransferase class IV [Saprospiraceae bacterium]
MQYHFILNKIVHQAEATISVFDLGLLRGYGAFDFFKVHAGVPVFMDDHIDRFFNSARLLHLTIAYSRTELKEVIYQLIKKNEMVDGTFKMVLTGGVSSNGFTMDGDPGLMILAGKLSFEIYSEYDKVKTMRLKTLDYVRETPTVKTLNYLMPMMHWNEVTAGQFDDVLYVKDGLISETSRANIFFITQDEKLVTPNKNILPGITRKYILELAKEMPVEEREISLKEALTCKEIFLTSTTKQVMPVVGIDEYLIGEGKRGELSGKLFDDFYALENNFIQKHKTQWI